VGQFVPGSVEVHVWVLLAMAIGQLGWTDREWSVLR
jgi:hypothetical protein